MNTHHTIYSRKSGRSRVAVQILGGPVGHRVGRQEPRARVSQVPVEIVAVARVRIEESGRGAQTRDKLDARAPEYVAERHERDAAAQVVVRRVRQQLLELLRIPREHKL